MRGKFMVTRRALRKPAIATTGSGVAVRPPFWNVRHKVELGAGLLAVAAAVLAIVIIAGSSDRAAVGGADPPSAIGVPPAGTIELTPGYFVDPAAGYYSPLLGTYVPPGAGALAAAEAAQAAHLRALRLADSINRVPVGEQGATVADSELPGALHAAGDR